MKAIFSKLRGTIVLNKIHKLGFTTLLSRFMELAYFVKGYGKVRVTYHKSFKAYELVIDGISYLSPGPGWAYNFEYLKNNLYDVYCFDYKPKENDCVVDVGAGLGEEVVILAQLVGRSGKIFAIEANPTTFSGLEYMCTTNKFSWVNPLNLAIFSSDGEVTIEDSTDNYLTNTINKPSSKNLTVPALTLDSIVAKHQITKIDFLRSNIEGAEQYLIHGMENSSAIIQNMCISCHDFRHNVNKESEFYVTKQLVIDFLIRKGFDVRTRSTNSELIDDHVYASRVKN